MAGTDFSHLTSDELIKGIKSLDLPDYIRSKAYGIDVRETLAQMTEMTIQLGVNMGLSPNDALKWARKLQETVSQSEFDSWVATLLDGGPSIFMNTLSELQTTYPNGAAGVALVRETDPAKIYVWNGSAWEDFGNYQGIEIKDGAVNTPKITDGAVSVEKLTTYLKNEILFYNNQIESFKENASVWTGNRADVSSDESFLRIVGKNTSGGYARGIAKVQPPYKNGDKIFVRLGVKITNNQGSPTSQVRVLLRNGLTGTIHAQPVFDANIDQFQYIHFTTTLVDPTDLTLMVDYYDSVDTNMVGKELTVSYTYVGNLTNLFGENTPTDSYVATMLGDSESIYNLENISKKMVDIEQNSQMINIDTSSLVNQSILQINKKPSGDVSYEVLDYLKYPLTISWGNEYLYGWYRALEDNADLTMVWSGDSTTANVNILEDYKRHNLGKQILVKSGFEDSKIDSINAGHGENTTVNWVETWLPEDMTTIQSAISANRKPIYILGWGINDGGLNYNPDTTIQERVDIFTNALNSGLQTVRSQYTPYKLPIILATPVATYDLTNKRNNFEWQNHIRDIVKKSARDYQCAFIDLGSYQYDRSFGSTWSSNGDNVHPNRYAIKDYMSAFKPLLVPYLFEK